MGTFFGNIHSVVSRRSDRLHSELLALFWAWTLIGRHWSLPQSPIECSRSVSSNEYGHIEWPARSPDLSICNFFLWGYVKEKVFRSQPHNLEELKMRIREEITPLPPWDVPKSSWNFRYRLQQCIAKEGHHFPDTIFKKWSQKRHCMLIRIKQKIILYVLFYFPNSLSKLGHLICLTL